ncbi:MAG: hypothetical protein FWF87_04415 [Synergistaceae bacterium]|nr:hypothetical protein [Synergistaceae bacterium]
MTAQTLKADRESIVDIVGHLPDRAILQIKGYIERLREEEMEREAEDEERRYQSMSLNEIDAEIASLRAKYGTTPNAKTIAAMKEVDAGLCEEITIEELKAQLHAHS